VTDSQPYRDSSLSAKIITIFMLGIYFSFFKLKKVQIWRLGKAEVVHRIEQVRRLRFEAFQESSLLCGSLSQRAAPGKPGFGCTRHIRNQR